MAQTVTSKIRVQSQASSCGIFGMHSDTGIDFCLSAAISPYHSTSALFIRLWPRLHKRLSSQRHWTAHLYSNEAQRRLVSFLGIVLNRYGVCVPVGQPARKHLSFFFFLLVLAAFVKLRKATLSFVMSQHGTPRLSLDGVSWNLIFEYFSKICWEISGFINLYEPCVPYIGRA